MRPAYRYATVVMVVALVAIGFVALRADQRPVPRQPTPIVAGEAPAGPTPPPEVLRTLRLPPTDPSQLPVFLEQMERDEVERFGAHAAAERRKRREQMIRARGGVIPPHVSPEDPTGEAPGEDEAQGEAQGAGGPDQAP